MPQTEFKVQLNAILKTIPHADLRKNLRNKFMQANNIPVSNTEALLNMAKTEITAYRYKMADYPELAEAFNRETLATYNHLPKNELDQFGYHISPNDRMMWQAFVLGFLAAQAA